MTKHSCEFCGDYGFYEIEIRHSNGVITKSEEDCQACCDHGDYDHGICGICGKDCYDDLVGQAEYAFEGER